MNNKKDSVFSSADYDNENFTGLFDRIINIKFTRKNGETFTLRSDYEPVWENGGLYFKTCQPKPEIRVQYTQYQATLINVDIFVTNLNIIESMKGNEDESMLNAGITAVTGSNTTNQGNETNQPNDVLTRLGNHVTKAEIEMGYRGQFFNWAQHKTTVFTRDQDYNAFLNLQIPGEGLDIKQLAQAQSMFKAYRKCSVVVEWATNISNPPDRITQFHGYIGSTDAGFQPFALQSIDCASESGATGLITKEDIYKGLDDEYNSVDQVLVEDVKAEEKTGGTAFDLVVRGRRTAFRNFFNGGKGFTLLEGYCFHMVTRRFVRANVEVKRNKLLEQASLEFTSAASYGSVASRKQISSIQKEVSQKVYRREQPFYPSYFYKEGSGDWVLFHDKSDVKPEDYATEDERYAAFVKYLEESITSIMAEHFIGARFTIKNLPEYRKLYLAIRKTLKETAEKGDYMTWWDAAEQLSNSSLTESPDFITATITNSDETVVKTIKRNEYQVIGDIQNTRRYTLDFENGELAFKDCYFSNILGRDWILPVQNIKSSVPLNDSRGRPIYFKPPTKISATGFGNPGADTKVKCFTGLFEVRDAYMFGVPVLCSREASRVFHTKHINKTSVVLQFLPDPQAQVAWICKTWDLRYYKLHNGGFYIYAGTENARETASQEFVTTQSNKPFRIPAIYDMTLSPIRKIRMPFVAFLDPMTIVEWNSTAMIGSMISYYYQPAKGRNFFLLIKNSVDFSTVGDFNTMELDLVDTQWTDKSEVPAAVLKQDKATKFIDVIISLDSQMNSWRKLYESPVCVIPFELLALWKETVNPDSYLTEDNRVANLQFFTLLQTWNPSLFAKATEAATGWEWDDSSSRVDKTANKTYGGSRPDKTNFPDLEYCFSITTEPSEQRIFMKFPLMPNVSDYTKMEEYDKKYVLLYENEVWEMRLKTEVQKTYKIEVV